MVLYLDWRLICLLLGSSPSFCLKNGQLGSDKGSDCFGPIYAGLLPLEDDVGAGLVRLGLLIEHQLDLVPKVPSRIVQVAVLASEVIHCSI